MFIGSFNNIIAGENGPTMDELEELAQVNPGAVWLVANEPNRRPGYEVLNILDDLHDSYAAIKAGDPTARIMSPPMLNWLFTCAGCSPGFTRGTDWAEEFRIEYFYRFGEEPPVDIWAINAYPLDWVNLPTTNPQIVINQIQGLRTWLNERPSQAGKPIWVTEIGLHWAWDGLTFDNATCPGLPFPVGGYHEDDSNQFLASIYEWLQDNAEEMNIERWFQYIAYHELPSCNTDGYNGIRLFDSPNAGARLTSTGEQFKQFAFGVD
jgi:hypothetical protein